MKDFRMPSLGADMEGGTLVEWLKSPGDAIHRGDIIAVVETVKGAIEIECFDDGVLSDVIVEPGTEIAVGEILAHIEGGETGPSQRPASEPGAPPPETVERQRHAAVPPAPLQPVPEADRLRASPAARRIADKLGVALADVAAGPDGVVGIDEVEAAAAKSGTGPAPAAPRQVKPGLDRDAMRQAIGAAMARSKREIPHYYVTSTLDVTPFFDWLEVSNATRSVSQRLLYAAPLTKAVAMALRSTPALNGAFVDGMHQKSTAIHVGIATALRGGGLIAPALHDTAERRLDNVMENLRDIVSRVRTGRIRSSELTNATVTLSILGDDTADTVLPVIYPPQVAIVGCGAVRERPWIVDDRIVPRRVMNVTVAGDHRVSDGRVAARFLSRLEEIVREPEQL